MTFKLDKRLNLVVPVERGDGTTVHVHSQPVPRAVFERYYRVIARTFSAIVGLGLGEVAGPRVAALEMRRTAEQLGEWEGPEGVEHGLWPEIRRLTNVLLPGPAGWETVPWQEVVDRKLLDDDDVSEVENAVCFFIVFSSTQRRTTLVETLDGAARLWGARVSSLSATEYAASLRTSKEGASTGERPPAAALDATMRGTAPGATVFVDGSPSPLPH